MPSQPIRVAAVPAAHPYVRAIAPDDGSVLLLPDPVVDPAHPHRWWPPAMLDATWIAAHARSLDVMHVHFGMESLQPGRLEGALDALEAHGIPLVYTVHDLENPQLEAQDAHRRDLDLLVPRAARLVTLTHAAAGRIRETWGREATVVAHPTLLDGVAAPTSTVTRPATIGIHLRDVRPSIDATGSVRSLLATLDDLRAEGVDAVGRILVNDATRDPGVADRIAALVRGRTDCELVRRPRPDDDALVSEVDRLDVAWLPYAHGTHSGWVELCFDRAVQVVGPADLPMSEQHADEYHAWSADGSATSAVRHALALATRAGSEERIAAVEQRLHLRRSERKAVRAAHAAIYRDQMTDSERPTEIHE